MSNFTKIGLRYLVILLAVCFYIRIDPVRSINWNLYLYKYQNYIISHLEVLPYNIRPAIFNRVISYINEENLEAFLKGIRYKSDTYDCSSLPIFTVLRGYGDCDDFSYLSSYILDKLGYRTYIIDMFQLDEGFGHSICIAVKEGNLVITDNYEVIIQKELTISDNLIIYTVMETYGYDVFAVRDKNLNLISIEWRYDLKGRKK